MISRKLAALTGSAWFWVAVVALLFAAPLARGLSQGRLPGPPPMLGAFPAFALATDDAEAFRPSDLRGRLFVADLLCAGCAERIEAMRTLQHRTRNLGDALRLVSFAEGLGPAALREVRARHGAGVRWTLVAGVPAGASALFAGANTALLVDGRLRIRGRYDVGRQDGIDHLLRDAALLVALP